MERTIVDITGSVFTYLPDSCVEDMLDYGYDLYVCGDDMRMINYNSRKHSDEEKFIKIGDLRSLMCTHEEMFPSISSVSNYVKIFKRLPFGFAHLCKMRGWKRQMARHGITLQEPDGRIMFISRDGETYEERRKETPM